MRKFLPCLLSFAIGASGCASNQTRTQQRRPYSPDEITRMETNLRDFVSDYRSTLAGRPELPNDEAESLFGRYPGIIDTVKEYKESRGLDMRQLTVPDAPQDEGVAWYEYPGYGALWIADTLLFRLPSFGYFDPKFRNNRESRLLTTGGIVAGGIVAGVNEYRDRKKDRDVVQITVEQPKKEQPADITDSQPVDPPETPP